MAMRDLVADDLHLFTDSEHGFGDTFTIPGGATLSGIFDEPYAEAVDVAGTKPTLSCQAAQVAGLEDQSITMTSGAHTGESFRVKRIEPDGPGMPVLILEAL